MYTHNRTIEASLMPFQTRRYQRSRRLAPHVAGVAANCTVSATGNCKSGATRPGNIGHAEISAPPFRLTPSRSRERQNAFMVETTSRTETD